jgi:HD-like signal output (HDOD) protein
MEVDHRIQAILASGIKIPPMPAILLRLNTLLRDPDAGPIELAALIRDDGALTGAVFRVVGSPVFGLHAKIHNLPHAIALLGMKNTAALLHSELLRSTLSDPQHALALERLWRRGAAIAERCVAIVKLAVPPRHQPGCRIHAGHVPRLRPGVAVQTISRLCRSAEYKRTLAGYSGT